MEQLLPADWPEWIQLLVVLGTGLLIGMIIKWILFATIRRQAKRSDNFTLQSINRCLAGPMTWFLPLLLMSILLNLWRSRHDGHFAQLATALEIALYIISAWTILRLVSIVADAIREQYNINEADNLEERKILTQLQYIQRITSIVVITVTIAVILLQFPGVRDIGQGLLTSAGVAGIIIGVAAQKSIANLLAGLQIAFTQPIRLDDVVIVQGEWGRIEEITLTYVVVRIWDQRRLVVPLQFFNENSFQNWTRTTSELIGTVFVYTDYTLPVNAIRTKVDELLAENERWDGRVKAVQVTDAKPDVMEVRVLVSAADAGLAFDLRCDIREALIAFIRDHHPECLPRTRVELGRDADQAAARERLENAQLDEPLPTSSPTPEDGKEEVVR